MRKYDENQWYWPEMTKAERLTEFDDANTTPDPETTLSAAGAPIFGGYLLEQEEKAALTGTLKYKTYTNNLLNIGIVAASVMYFLNLLGKPTWKAEPADESDAAVEKAELVDDMMGDMDSTWERVVKRAAMFKFYGFSVQEWTAKVRDDGNIGIESIEPVAQKTIEKWDTDTNGKVFGFVQRAPQDHEEIYIPRDKTIYIVDDALNDSPEGMGLFRMIAEAARKLQKYEQLEGQGFETDLRGVPIARAPLTKLKALVDAKTIPQAQMNAIVAPMNTFIGNHVKSPSLGVLLDSQPYKTDDEKQAPSGKPEWDLSLLKAGSTSQSEVNTAIIRKNQEISRIMGTENLMTGNDGRGSQSLSKDKSKNFFLTVDGALKELAKSFSRDLLGPIWDLNGWDKALMPTFKTESLQFRDVEDITAAIRDMAQAGAPLTIDDPAVDELRDMLGLSRAPMANMLSMMEDGSLRNPVPAGVVTRGVAGSREDLGIANNPPGGGE